MFNTIVVDGSSSCVPGEGAVRGMAVGEEALGEGVDGENLASPGPSQSHSKSSIPFKRRANSTASSPPKKVKNPMVKVMKGIHATLETSCAIANKAMSGEQRNAEIQEVMDLAVECGATEDTMEHFMATQLFSKPDNRGIFKALKTKQGRLLWLKRWCAKEGLTM